MAFYCTGLYWKKNSRNVCDCNDAWTAIIHGFLSCPTIVTFLHSANGFLWNKQRYTITITNRGKLFFDHLLYILTVFRLVQLNVMVQNFVICLVRPFVIFNVVWFQTVNFGFLSQWLIFVVGNKTTPENLNRNTLDYYNKCTFFAKLS